ncbi:MAG TPA: STAS/SEC14 domain-containing protein [Telluria sp.]
MALQQLWIEPVGGIIVARIRGELTEALLRECQDRVVSLARDTQYSRVLYDTLELEAPGIDLVILQQKMVESELQSINLRRAFVVQNTRVAYLARLGFGEGDHRVFYNDLAAALSWLQEPATGASGA